MPKEIPALSDDELTALAAIDGTRGQPAMKPALEARLSLLRLTERREWPNGPLWRTTKQTPLSAEGAQSPAFKGGDGSWKSSPTA